MLIYILENRLNLNGNKSIAITQFDLFVFRKILFRLGKILCTSEPPIYSLNL